LDSKGSLDIGFIYAAIEKESRQTLKIDRILILDKEKKPLMLLGKPIWWDVDTNKDSLIKGVIAFIVCRGELESMRKVYPGNIFLMNRDEFNETLQEVSGFVS